MKTYRAWCALACVALAVGCNKSEPAAGGSAGTATTVKTSGGTTKPVAAAAGQTPDAYVQGVVDSVTKGDAGAVWNALPAKYQADVVALKAEFAGKMDAEMYNKAFVVAGKLSTLLKDKKAMILASPLGAQVPPPVKAMAEANWDNVTTALNTLVSSEIKTLEGLKSTDPGKFLGSTGTSLAAGVLKAVEASDPNAAAGIAKARKSKVELVKQDGDTATLKLVVEGEAKPEEKVFKKIDGKWLPVDVIEGWEKSMADAKAELAGFTIPPEAKAQFNGAVGMVEPILDKLIAAKDQAAFDGEVQGLLAIAAMFGGGPPGGAMQGPPGGGLAPPGGPGGLTPPGGTGTLPPLTPPAGLPVLPPSGGVNPTIVPPVTTTPVTTPPATTPSTTPTTPKP